MNLAQLLKKLDVPGDAPRESFRAALTHPSYKGLGEVVEDYERLEFLGDAALDLIVAEYLYKTTGNPEGTMTEERRALVNNQALGRAFDGFDLQGVVRVPPRYHFSNKDKANFVEALVGALFVVRGYAEAKKAWRRAILPLLQEPDVSPVFERVSDARNARNALQEYCQQRALPVPHYEIVAHEGPDHAPTFKARVRVEITGSPEPERVAAIAWGPSKQEARMRVAEKACARLGVAFQPR